MKVDINKLEKQLHYVYKEITKHYDCLSKNSANVLFEKIFESLDRFSIPNEAESYVYLIKYFNDIIAVVEDEEFANRVIEEYIQNNKGTFLDNFTIEPIRFIGVKKD